MNPFQLFPALAGYRTYILIGVNAVLAIADAAGYHVPAWIFALFASAGLTTARIATDNVSAKP